MKKPFLATVNKTSDSVKLFEDQSPSLSLPPWSSLQQSTIYFTHEIREIHRFWAHLRFNTVSSRLVEPWDRERRCFLIGSRNHSCSRIRLLAWFTSTLWQPRKELSLWLTFWNLLPPRYLISGLMSLLIAWLSSQLGIGKVPDPFLCPHTNIYSVSVVQCFPKSHYIHSSSNPLIFHRVAFPAWIPRFRFRPACLGAWLVTQPTSWPLLQMFSVFFLWAP